jgi:hypothetical protein
MQSVNAREIWSIFLMACTAVGVQLGGLEDTRPAAPAASATRNAKDPFLAGGMPTGGDAAAKSRISESAVSSVRGIENVGSGTAGTRQAQARPRSAHPRGRL